MKKQLFKEMFKLTLVILDIIVTLIAIFGLIWFFFIKG